MQAKLWTRLRRLLRPAATVDKRPATTWTLTWTITGDAKNLRGEGNRDA